MRFDEPLSLHSTFKIGGSADVYAVPSGINDLEALLSAVRSHSVPYFILGGGANILFSDIGFSGIVIDMLSFNNVSVNGTSLLSGAGVPFSRLSEIARDNSLSGLEFFYGMPGTAGGSIYMNARCYGSSVSDILSRVTYIDSKGSVGEYKTSQKDFGYKISPFQDKGFIITAAEFQLEKGSMDNLSEKMSGFKNERVEKGHYLYPCAGSVFKNNREFGQPSGKIIDSLGLRSYSIGGAMISPLHANIIVNKGNASSNDVRELISFVEDKVYKTYGFKLEKEIIFI